MIYEKQPNPYTKKANPFSNQSPYSKDEFKNLLLEDSTYLLLETGEKIYV